jgi:putative transposase
MVQHGHATLSIVRQCDLLSISRSGLYHAPKSEPAINHVLMREIDLTFTEWPFPGVRQMRSCWRLPGYSVAIKCVRRLMRLMGLMPIYQKTSVPHPEHRRYPYLLRDLTITGPNQVRCSDITSLPMRKGFLYLVAIMVRHSRKVLSRRLSNTMDADFCIAALEEALAKHGKPAIFNTDQGSRFTSFAFTNVLRENEIRISMNGRAASWTTCLSNASGGRSNMRRSIFTPMKAVRRPVPASASGLSFIIRPGHTAVRQVQLPT